MFMTKHALKLIQVVILAHYVSAGLWKVRDIVHIYDLSYLGHASLDHMAHAILEGNLVKNTILSFLMELPVEILGLAFLTIILFQISCVTPIFKESVTKTYGVLLILFHAITHLTLNISFKSSVLSIIFFFIIMENKTQGSPKASL